MTASFRMAFGNGARSAAVGALAALVALSANAAAQCPDGHVGVCAGPPPEKSVAVLPFRNIGADPSQQYFADGVADAILDGLAKLPGVKVSARSSSFTFRGQDVDVRVVGDSLGVAKVVDGSVMKVGGRVRITASVSDTRTRVVVWSDKFDRPESEIFELLDDVSRAIADRMELSSQASSGSFVRRGTNVSLAHDHLLRGRELLARRTNEGVLGSIKELETAIRLDRRYAEAYAGLASAYGLGLVLIGYATPGVADTNYAWAGRALAAANLAIRLDSASAEAYAARGYLEMYGSGPASAAGADLEHAIRLKPSYADAFGWYAQFLARSGRDREAMPAVYHAIELDPLSLGMRLARISTLLVVDSAETLLHGVRVIQALHPSVPWTHLVEGMALVLLHRTDECIGLTTLPPGLDAMCMYSAGRAADAARHIDSLAASPKLMDLPYAFSNVVTYQAWTAQVDESVRWLKTWYQRTPVDPLGAGPLDAPVRKRGGASFTAAVEQLQSAAWARVVEESRKATFR